MKTCRIDPHGRQRGVDPGASLVSEAAAKWAFADADGKPGVIIFTDSTYQIAIDKADKMKEVM